MYFNTLLSHQCIASICSGHHNTLISFRALPYLNFTEIIKNDQLPRSMYMTAKTKSRNHEGSLVKTDQQYNTSLK